MTQVVERADVVDVPSVSPIADNGSGPDIEQDGKIDLRTEGTVLAFPHGSKTDIL